jgi:hypothetical protein
MLAQDRVLPVAQYSVTWIPILSILINMMEEIDSQFESCLKTLVEVTEISGNLRNDLRRSIISKQLKGSLQ